MRLIIRALFCLFFVLPACTLAQTTIQSRPYTSITTSTTCTATADTELGGSWAASKAIDGDFYPATDTGWISTGTALPHWLALDCGSDHAITWIDHLPWRPDRHTKSVDIYVSDDGSTWGSSVCTHSGEPDTFSWRQIACSGGTHRYFKLQITDVWGTTAASVNDVEFGGGTRWRAIAATNTAVTPDGTDPNNWYRDGVTDGNSVSGWSSCSGCIATITIDLLSPTSFDGVALGSLTNAATILSIYTSPDNITYTQWTTDATRNSLIGSDSIFLLPARKTARYVKVEGSALPVDFFQFYEFNLVTYAPYGAKPHVFVVM